MKPSKDRLAAEVAAAAGRADVAAAASKSTRTRRDATMARAHRDGLSYAELQAATGLTRTGVYKALSSAAGGSLKSVSTDEPIVD
jgi:hypothetical protein